MVQAAAAAEITRLIGLPEACSRLRSATIYLARAPKSNAVLRAYSAARTDATETAREPRAFAPQKRRDSANEKPRLW